MALAITIGEAPGPRHFSREDGDHRSLGSLFVRAARPLMTLSRRRQRAAADGGDELITNLGGAQAAPSAVCESRLLLASLALLSDHETAVSRRTSPQPLGRRFSLVPYRPLAASCAAIDCVERFGQSGVIVVWL